MFRTAFTGDFTHEKLIDLLEEYSPSPSGRRFAYGNLGYNLLGMVLESTSSESWKEVVRQEVLAPMGMEQTSAYVSRIPTQRIALPHGVAGSGFERLPLRKADANMHAAGGHFATPRDLARFVAAHLSGRAVDREAIILRRSALEATHRKYADQDREFGPFHRFGWGYGWDLGTYERDTVVHRFGSFSGYRSHMSFMPEHGIGVIVLVNAAGPASPAADLMATYVYDRLLGKPGLEENYAVRLETFRKRLEDVHRRLAGHLAERAARLEALAHPLEDYAGIYESPRLGRMEWRVVANGLDVWMGVAWSRAEVFDASEDMLRVELTGGGSVVDFEFPPGGGPASSLLYRTGPDGGEELVRVVR